MLFERTRTAHLVGIIGGVVVGHVIAWTVTPQARGVGFFFYWLMVGLAMTLITFGTTAVLRLANAKARLPAVVVYPIGAALFAWPIFELLSLRPEGATISGVAASFVAGLALAFGGRDDEPVGRSVLWVGGRVAQFMILASLALVGLYALLAFVGGPYP